ncbi:MAG: hypothetical protein JSS87_06035 [Acidobacteria bacterium]|nr:hypothetical protein [Acidobacteriota bacterium]
MRLLAAILLFTASFATAQMHHVRDPQAVTRAIGVYEWTGDINKPEGSRLVPVSLFIYGHFEDAAIYLAQPVPLALASDTRYQLQVAGAPKGFIDLSFARNLHAPGAVLAAHYDDGWFGYGKYLAPKKPKIVEETANVRQGDAHVVQEGGPKFTSKPDTKSNGKDDEAEAKVDSDQPDPERPTFKREEITTGNPRKDQEKQQKKRDVSGVSEVPPDPTKDDNRPVFRRRDTSAPPLNDAPGVTEKRSALLDDPNRPTLHRGRPAGSMTGEDIGGLKGIPDNMHQMVAVSDAVDRPEHDFTHPFLADTERDKIKAQMETMARSILANPALAAQTANPTATPNNAIARLERSVASTADNASHSAGTSTSRSVTSSRRRAKTAPTHAAGRKSGTPGATSYVLEDVQFYAYDLAYNSTPTYVLTAHTEGTGEQLRYVTVVAAPDTFGTLQPLLRSLTDADHLNRTPRLRLVDAVDADASNRASLLFELRKQNARQFALYRIYGGKATQIFLTGTTQ